MQKSVSSIQQFEIIRTVLYQKRTFCPLPVNSLLIFKPTSFAYLITITEEMLCGKEVTPCIWVFIMIAYISFWLLYRGKTKYFLKVMKMYYEFCWFFSPSLKNKQKTLFNNQTGKIVNKIDDFYFMILLISVIDINCTVEFLDIVWIVNS